MSKKTKSNLNAPAPLPVARQADELRMIPRTELQPDLDQPRKQFDATALEELAESIRQQGIVQPLIVRRMEPCYALHEPDLNHSGEWFVTGLVGEDKGKELFTGTENLCRTWAGEWNLKGYFVIVAGERRWRAAELAGLEALPCIVRDVQGHAVFAQQWMENESRVNISVLEEANALTKQLESRRREQPEFSVDMLATELSMSRAGLYARLALTRLHQPVREALLAGQISTSVAAAIAVVPLVDAQEKLLKQVTNENDWQFPFSVREVQKIVAEDYCRQLKDAAFSTKLCFPTDSNGPMYGGTCDSCPHRTGNMTELFPELAARPNVCTRPDCFAAKTKAHWLAQAQEKAQAGVTVLTEKEFRKVKAEYVKTDAPAWEMFTGAAGSIKECLGTVKIAKPKPALVSTDAGLVEVYKRVDVVAAAKPAKLKLRNDAVQKAETPEQKAKRKADEKAEQAAGERRSEFVKAKLPELANAIAKVKPAAAWELAERLFEEGSNWPDGRAAAVLEKAKTCMARLLGALFARNYPLYHDGWNKVGVAFWLELGIDLVKEFDAAEQARAKAPDLALAKAAPKQKELLVVKKHKKGKRS